jgi:hypothetical protein
MRLKCCLKKQEGASYTAIQSQSVTLPEMQHAPSAPTTTSSHDRTATNAHKHNNGAFTSPQSRYSSYCATVTQGNHNTASTPTTPDITPPPPPAFLLHFTTTTTTTPTTNTLTTNSAATLTTTTPTLPNTAVSTTAASTSVLTPTTAASVHATTSTSTVLDHTASLEVHTSSAGGGGGDVHFANTFTKTSPNLVLAPTGAGGGGASFEGRC